MKLLPLLLLLIAVRTCTKETPGVVEKKVQSVEVFAPEEDSVIVAIKGPFSDDLKTRGFASPLKTKLTSPIMLEPDFSRRFTYPETAKAERIAGSCTIQFGIDAQSSITFFSVLNTTSKLFSDDMRQVIMDRPIAIGSFPRGEESIRFEVTANYKLAPRVH